MYLPARVPKFQQWHAGAVDELLELQVARVCEDARDAGENLDAVVPRDGRELGGVVKEETDVEVAAAAAKTTSTRKDHH